MASGSCSSWVAVCLILMLACQTWICAAYNNQQAKWLTKHLTRTSPSASATTQTRGSAAAGHVRTSRHLGESTIIENGWRANLVNEDHRLHSSFNLSSAERIALSVEKSKSRAWGLDLRARRAHYSVGPGRKALQSHDSTNGVTKSAVGPGRKALQSASPSFESTVVVSPGSYSMSFSLGTPVQNFVAIADTGSDLVWIQCAACSICFNQSSPLFDPSASTTYVDIGCTMSSACSNLGNNELQCSTNCQYTYSYGDQSSTVGNFALETVTLSNSGGVSSVVQDFQFGCGLQNQGTFTDTDGIIGLARGAISFPSQISSYLNNVNKFSYCLVSRYENETVTSPIIFGEAAVPTNVTGTSYTPLQTPYNVSDVPYYYVNLLGITVGSTAVSIPAAAFQLDSSGNGGTIFDSGTTYTVLNTNAYTPVLNEFTTQIGSTYSSVNLTEEVGLDLCYDVSGLDSVSVPNLIFKFENAEFDLPFDNIFIVFNTGQSSYMCLTLLEAQGLNIFGNSQQQNFQVVYEEDSKRIGWVAQDCQTL